MSFIGIDNSTEYYSNHYLAAILEKDLQQVIFKTEDKDGLNLERYFPRPISLNLIHNLHVTYPPLAPHHPPTHIDDMKVLKGQVPGSTWINRPKVKAANWLH